MAVTPQAIQRKISEVEARIQRQQQLLADLNALLSTVNKDYEHFTELSNSLKTVMQKIRSLEAEKEKVNARLRVLRKERKRISKELNASNVVKILKMLKAL